MVVLNKCKKIKSEKVFVTLKTYLPLDRWVCNRCCIKELRCILIESTVG